MNTIERAYINGFLKAANYAAYSNSATPTIDQITNTGNTALSTVNKAISAKNAIDTAGRAVKPIGSAVSATTKAIPYAEQAAAAASPAIRAVAAPLSAARTVVSALGEAPGLGRELGTSMGSGKTFGQAVSSYLDKPQQRAENVNSIGSYVKNIGTASANPIQTVLGLPQNIYNLGVKPWLDAAAGARSATQMQNRYNTQQALRPRPPAQPINAVKPPTANGQATGTQPSTTPAKNV